MSEANEAFVDDENEECSNSPSKANNLKKSEQTGILDLQEEFIEDNHMDLQKGNFLAVGLTNFWNSYNTFISRHWPVIRKLLGVSLVILIIVYAGAVIRQFQLNGPSEIDWCHGYGMAFICFTLMTWAFVYYGLIVPYLTPYLIEFSNNRIFINTWKIAHLVIAALVALFFAVFLILDTASYRRRLISVGGLFTFIGLGFIFSKHPTKIKWRTIFMGIAIQFMMGLLAIRWNTGRQVFKCAGKLAEDILSYGYVGASFVFGQRIVREDGVFAFKALSVIFFVSMIVQVLFYLGWMQVFCMKLGWIIQSLMGTTVMESVNAVSSVFLGMTEAPLLYKPYIKDLTPSEIHAVMVGGFSTIAGTVFAAYTSLGVNPAHIITAALMAAPAALCYAKLLYPETMQTATDSKNIKLFKSEDKSVMDAAIQGALVGINMVQGIIASVIACVSVVALFNDFLAYLGLLVGVENFTLETIFAYLLFPAVWLMGVETSQCLLIARLIGIKITVNEFIAYGRLGELTKTGVLSPRTEAIATYALCSFANPGSVGVLISTLTTLSPTQRFNIISVSSRAFVTAIIVSFLTACITGALMPEEGFSN